MSDHEEETINEENAHPKVVLQITTVTNISAKFPYLKKGEYDIWAMKIQNFISSFDLLCWNIVLKGNSAKSMTTDKDDEHMGDFYHMIDVRDIWNAIKVRFGRNAESKKMQKSLLKQKFEEFKISEEEGLDKGYDKMQKILRGFEYISFDDMYNKLKFLEINTKGYSSSPSTFSNAAFISLDQMNKEEFEEYDLKNQMAMLSIKKYKSKEAGKDRSDSKAMVVVDGSIDWDKQTEGGNIEPRSLDNFGMIAGIKIESDADLKSGVVSGDDAIPAGVFVPAGTVAAVVVSPQSETEFALMGLSTEAKCNNSGKNLYKLIDSSMSVRTKRGLGLDKYIGEGNYMPASNIPDIDESQMVYRKKATYSSKIKTTDDSITHTNDSVLFDFSDRSSELSTNDLKICDSSVECSRPNHSDHDSTSSVFAPASESRDKQEDFPSVCSIKTDVKSFKPLCNKFGSFNKESHFRKHKSVASKSCYLCGSYLHLIKDCDFHEQTFAKRNAEGTGILGIRPTGKPFNLNRPEPVFTGQQNPVSAGLPNPISAGQQNTVSAGQPNPVSAGLQNTVSASPPNPVYAGQPNLVYAGDGILGPRPLNIQPTSTYFHSFTHNN
nr:hypothetical protein [Tanacetum cinerariifolium]